MNKKNLRQILETFVPYLIGITIFFLILSIPPTFSLKELTILVRYNLIYLAPLVLVGLFFCFRLSYVWGKTISLTFTLALFALALLGLWTSGASEQFVLSGLLPYSDAYGHYTGALGLLNTGRLLAFTSRRPLFGGFLAVLLWITGNNLQTTLALLVAFTGVATWLAADQINKSHGSIPAALFSLVLFLFFRRFAGTTLTENLGYILGMLGFALVWQSVSSASKNSHIISILAGFFFTSLALNARPGAMFILPGLCLWAGWQWRGTKRFSWKICLLASLVIFSAFAINLGMHYLIASPASAPFSNMAYGLYSVVMGNQSWSQIYADAPEITNIPAGEQTQFILSMIFEQIHNNPMHAISSILQQYQILFSTGESSIYSYLLSGKPTISLIAILILYVMAVLGLFDCWRKRQGGISSLLLIITAGFLLSIPFAPSGQVVYMRIYAATIFLFAILPALGLNALIQHFKINALTVKPAKTKPSFENIIIGSFLLFLTIVSPLILKFLIKPTTITKINCPDTQEAIVLRFSSGTNINLVKDEIEIIDWLPNYHLSIFRLNSHNICCGAETELLSKVEAPATIAPIFNTSVGEMQYVVAQEPLSQYDRMNLGFCGNFVKTREIYGIRLFFVKSMQVLSGEIPNS